MFPLEHTLSTVRSDVCSSLQTLTKAGPLLEYQLSSGFVFAQGVSHEDDAQHHVATSYDHSGNFVRPQRAAGSLRVPTQGGRLSRVPFPANRQAHRVPIRAAGSLRVPTQAPHLEGRNARRFSVTLWQFSRSSRTVCSLLGSRFELGSRPTPRVPAVLTVCVRPRRLTRGRS